MKKYLLPILSTVLLITLISITCFLAGAIYANQRSKQPIITQNIITQIIITLITPTQYPTFTPAPPQTIIITATPIPPSPTPNTPPPSPTPQTPTQPPLTADHNPGIYLVNIDIAPGVWRNNGTADNCYWEITDRQGNLIENHYGLAGGTMYIPPNAYQVQLEKQCGTWTYLGPP